MIKIGLNILGALGLLIGCVWMLQGLDYLGGSFMSGERQWFWIGVVVAAVCVIWLARLNFGRRHRRP
jgi:hypothetical protein